MPKQAVFFLIDSQCANFVGCYSGNPGWAPRTLTASPARASGSSTRTPARPCAGRRVPRSSTGLFPHSNGVLGNSQAPHIDIPTLGQRLTGAGIRAGYIGKWHLDGTDYFGDGRCPPGWDPEYWFDGRNYLQSLPDESARDLSRRVLGPREGRRARCDGGVHPCPPHRGSRGRLPAAAPRRGLPARRLHRRAAPSLHLPGAVRQRVRRFPDAGAERG